MCGIVAMRAFGPVSAFKERGFRALDAIAHRGPDDSGWLMEALSQSPVFLGHRRLSILDLSPAGHQPIVSQDTGDILIFNGEIYNLLELRQELEKLGETFTSDFRQRGDSKQVCHRNQNRQSFGLEPAQTRSVNVITAFPPECGSISTRLVARR